MIFMMEWFSVVVSVMFGHASENVHLNVLCRLHVRGNTVNVFANTNIMSQAFLHATTHIHSGQLRVLGKCSGMRSTNALANKPDRIFWDAVFFPEHFVWFGLSLQSFDIHWNGLSTHTYEWMYYIRTLRPTDWSNFVHRLRTERRSVVLCVLFFVAFFWCLFSSKTWKYMYFFVMSFSV